ncbi:uncharacterized protein LOC115229283 isoform X1 [Octopus sinensis]|uniref:Uncharacterized protein LOC115229283 isoform X1 n=1 Tax=Octopus sinensis TaxID=2607531 RepID=A0A7E6EIF7_9MOLL|nr:uncharacterized protein LOC115229283 isoform X1 [Octopus sinensis]
MSHYSICLIILYILHGILQVSCYSNGHNLRTKSISAGGKCLKNDSCSCTFENGTEINLHFLDTKPRPRFTIDSEFQKYSWNPCTGYTVGDTKDVAMAMNGGVLGLQAGASFRTFETNDFGIYYSSYAVVILNCSDNMRINFKLKDNCPQGMILCFEYSGPCHIKTPHVPVEPKKLSTGSIISIVTFSIIIVYLVGGCLVTSFYLNSTGMERCPNVTLWSKLGSLIKDGFSYTFSKVKSSSRSSYESI